MLLYAKTEQLEYVFLVFHLTIKKYTLLYVLNLASLLSLHVSLKCLHISTQSISSVIYLFAYLFFKSCGVVTGCVDRISFKTSPLQRDTWVTSSFSRLKTILQSDVSLNYFVARVYIVNNEPSQIFF